MLFRRQCTEVFLRNVVWSLLGNIGQGLPVPCCPKSITATLNRIFSIAILSGATWTTLQKLFFLYNVVPRILRQHWTWFLPVQCCPKTIKKTLKRIFSCAMWSGASMTTLHRVFSVQYYPKSIKITLNRNFS